jgi:hypothetical protein
LLLIFYPALWYLKFVPKFSSVVVIPLSLLLWRMGSILPSYQGRSQKSTIGGAES